MPPKSTSKFILNPARRRYVADPELGSYSELDNLGLRDIAYLCVVCHRRYVFGGGAKFRTRCYRCKYCFRLMHDSCKAAHVPVCRRLHSKKTKKYTLDTSKTVDELEHID